MSHLSSTEDAQKSYRLSARDMLGCALMVFKGFLIAPEFLLKNIAAEERDTLVELKYDYKQTPVIPNQVITKLV